MKRKIISLAVVVMAITFSAFSVRTTESKMAQFYWFPLDAATGWPNGTRTLVYQNGDPYLCTPWGLGSYCAGAFTSYYMNNGLYFASGFEPLLDYHLFF